MFDAALMFMSIIINQVERLLAQGASSMAVARTDMNERLVPRLMMHVIELRIIYCLLFQIFAITHYIFDQNYRS